jgi:hypothetical protein
MDLFSDSPSWTFYYKYALKFILVHLKFIFI